MAAGRVQEFAKVMEPVRKAVGKRENAILDVIIQILRSSTDEPIETASLERAVAILGRYTDDAEAASVLSSALIRLERYAEALDALDLAAAGGVNARMLERRGRLLMALERTSDAAETFAESLALDPRNPTLHAAYARALTSLERLEDARQSIELALELDRTNLQYQLTALEIAQRQSDWRRVVEHARTAAAILVPGDVPATLACGLLWVAQCSSSEIDSMADRYAATGELTAVGQGLVAWIPHLAAAGDVAAEWLDAWEVVANSHEELVLSVRMARAAVEFARTRDRSHLLTLPNEQREIVVELLQRGEDGFELGDDVT